MPNSNYARGAAFERKVKEYLESIGFYAVRAAGSHGLTDIIAIAPTNGRGRVLFIQCKTGKAWMPVKDRLELWSVATKFKAWPLLAMPGENQDVVFHYIGHDGTLIAKEIR